MSIEEQLLEERRHTNVILEEIRRDFKVFGEGLAHQGQQISELRQDVDGVKVDVALIKSDVSILKSDVAVLKSDVAVLKSNVAMLNKRATRIEHHVGLNGSKRKVARRRKKAKARSGRA